MNIHRMFSRGCCLFKSQGDVTPTPSRVMQDTIWDEFEGAVVGYTMYGNPYLWMVYRVDDILSCAAYFGGGFTTSFYPRYHRERVDILLFENCTTLQTLQFTTVPDTGESDYTEEFLELEL